MKTFYAWLSNNTDCRDDEPMKVKAKDILEATQIVFEKMDSYRFSLVGVYAKKEFKERYPGWIEDGLI
jgi:hypothetical protein